MLLFWHFAEQKQEEGGICWAKTTADAPAVLWAAAVPTQGAALSAKLTNITIRVLTLVTPLTKTGIR